MYIPFCLTSQPQITSKNNLNKPGIKRATNYLKTIRNLINNKNNNTLSNPIQGLMSFHVWIVIKNMSMNPNVA